MKSAHCYMSLRDRFDAKWLGEPNSGCWLWGGALAPKGYGRIQKNGRHTKAHRVAYELHCGPIPEGLCVLHRCDVPSCVNPSHLFLGTNQDNMRDKMAKGRHRTRPVLGEENGRSKLAAADVLAIRASPLTTREAARAFGVTSSQIARIRQRKLWSHI